MVEKIYIAIMIIILSIQIFYMVYYPKKEKENYEKIKKSHPEMKQKFKIFDSRHQNIFKDNTYKNILLLIFMSLVVFGVGLGISLVCLNFSNQDLVIRVLLIIIIFIIMYREYIKLSSRSKLKKTFEKLLFEKHGEFSIVPKPADEIISGKMFQLGNIKKDYIY